MIKRKLSVKIVIFLFLLNFFPLAFIQAYKPWGQACDDGSEIQVYWESVVQEKDFRIPQDLTLLETDEFKVWIRSVYFAEGKEDSFTVRLFDYHLETIQSFDSNTNETRTKQERVYNILKDEITINISAGQSPYEWSDSRFGIVSINKETFPAFKNVNRTERVQVIFHEMIIEFDHWTNISEIEVTKTYGEFNVEILYWLFCGIIIIFTFIFLAYLIHRRAGLSPPPPSWYLWPMFGGVILGIMYIIILMMGLPIELLQRTIVVLPPLWLPVLAGIWLDFYLPNKFSGKVKPYLFLEIDGDTQVIVGIWPLWGYFKKEQLEFVKKKNAYWEFIKRLFVGGFPQPDWIFNPKVPIKSKNKELPHVYGVKSFKATPSKFVMNIKWYIVFISFVVLPGMAVLPLLFSMANFMTGIASVILFILAGVFFVVTSVRLTSPKLEVEQILHPSEAQALTNVNAIKAMQGFVKETLDNHMTFVAESEKGYFDRLKASIKRYADAYRGDTKKKEESVKEVQEKLKELKEVIEWSQSKGLLEKLDKKSVKG